jgi:hypothetical protein
LFKPIFLKSTFSTGSTKKSAGARRSLAIGWIDLVSIFQSVHPAAKGLNTHNLNECHSDYTLYFTPANFIPKRNLKNGILFIIS